MSLYLHLNRNIDNLLCKSGKGLLTQLNDDSLLANPTVEFWCLVGVQETIMFNSVVFYFSYILLIEYPAYFKWFYYLILIIIEL